MINISLSIGWQVGDFAPVDDPLAAWKSSLDLLNAKIADNEKVFESVATDVFEPAVQAQIETEGGFMGTPWMPLAESTVATRERLGFAGQHPMLVRDGMLRDSFLAGDSEHIQEISEDQLVWGSALPKALYLHAGTQEGYRVGRSSLGLLGVGLARVQGARGIGMPGRPLWQTTPEIAEQILAKFAEAAMTDAEEANFGTIQETT